MESQCERVMAYMREHGTITQLEATDAIGVTRLAARVADLRARGEPIRSEMVRKRNRYGETCRVAQYSMGKGKG